MVMVDDLLTVIYTFVAGWVAGIVQTLLYADFFYYYIMRYLTWFYLIISFCYYCSFPLTTPNNLQLEEQCEAGATSLSSFFIQDRLGKTC